jgi:phosphonoacetaldehyde hydrolase
MGLDKKDHLRSMLQDPEVARRWNQVHDQEAMAQDVEQLYHDFKLLQLEQIERHGRLVPGLSECVAELRRRGVRIGATTGYFREAAERVYRAARDQGFVPDCTVCSEDVPEGRPAPWMVFRIMEALRVYPSAAVVKIGDTVPDVEEGLNAGAWSIGVTSTGSDVGCTEEELAALPEGERRERLARARRLLLHAGSHAVIDSLAELPSLVDDLEARVRRGERP